MVLHRTKPKTHGKPKSNFNKPEKAPKSLKGIKPCTKTMK